jgi:polysaccharide export outer membrane protein
MKKLHNFSSLPFLLFLVIIALLSSCVTQKQVKYLQKLQKEDTVNNFATKPGPEYRIQPKDNLYIKIFSLDEKTYSFFNKGGTSGFNDYVNDAAIYLNSYGVSGDGNIEFPIIGKVYIKDLTVEQAKDMLQKLVDEYLKETMVVVKLVNFNLTVLGEVKRPGQFKIYQENISIFEALSLAGDLTDFADRGRIALVRQTKDGARVSYLDLKSNKILNSEFYYLKPNDIIYVAPLGVKRWGFEAFPWAVVLSAISTALLLINYFKI